MSWYYAENNERRGPIEDAAFDSLVSSGSVRPETLVWREGMTNWLPLSASGYHRPGASPAPNILPVPAGAGEEESPRQPAVEMGVCSESGRILPRSELVEIDGRLVSAEYKNVVLQRIREGVGDSSSDPEALAQEIIARDYQLSVGSCVARGWSTVQQNLGLCVGAVLVVMFVNLASAMTGIGPFFTTGPLLAGLYWMNLRLHRNEPASLGDAFEGFSRNYWHLVGVLLLVSVTMVGIFFFATICFVVGSVMSTPNNPSIALLVIGGLLFLAGFPVMVYLMTSWVFSFTLIIDKRFECWAALKLSRRIVSMHWWRVFGVLIAPSLLALAVILGAGIICLTVWSILAAIVHDFDTMRPITGILIILFSCFCAVLFIVAIPLKYAAIVAAYEDIFGARPSR